MSKKGGEAYFGSQLNGGFGATPVLLEATAVGALSAQLSRSRS